MDSRMGRLADRKDFLARRVRKMVRHVLENEKEIRSDISGLNHVLDSRKPILFRSFWFICLAMSLLTCTYQCTSRVLYFLSLPVTVDVLFTERTVVPYPSGCLCAFQTRKIVEMYITKFGNYSNICVAMKEFSSLMHIDNVTLEEIWDASNSVRELLRLQGIDGSFLEFNDTYTSKPYDELTSDEERKAQVFKITLVRTPLGTCYLASLINKQPYVPSIMHAVNFVTRITPNGCKRSASSFSYQYNDYKLIDPSGLVLITSGVHSHYDMMAREYSFINRKQVGLPCSTTEEYIDCVYNCQQRMFRRVSPDCKFPFMDADDLPMCKTGVEAFALYIDLSTAFLRLSPTADCKCPKMCQFFSYEFAQQTIGVNQNTTSVQYQTKNNLVLTFNERKIYDEVSLLCDIGGNLGLYLGLSVLAVFSQMFLLLKQFKKKGSRYGPNDPILRKVKKCYEEWKNNSMYKLKSKGIGSDDCLPKLVSTIRTIRAEIKLSNLLIVSFCSTMFVGFVASRFALYLKQPSNTVVNIIENSSIYFPSVIICGATYYLELLQMNTGPKIRSDFCNTNLYDFMDMTLPEGPEKLWNITSVRRSLRKQDASIEFSRIKIKPKQEVNLVVGKCLEIDIGQVEYAGVMSALLVRLFRLRTCVSDLTKVYLTPPFEAFSYISDTEVPVYGISGLAFKASTMKRFSKSFKPCTDRDVFQKCMTKCTNKKLQAVLKCWMPFVPEELGLPFCNSTNSSLVTKYHFEKIVYNIQPENCKCLPKCDDTIITHRFFTEIDSTVPMSVFAFLYQYSVIEAFEEIPSYSFVKFICDFGGNLGLFLGADIMTVLEYIHFAFEGVSKFFKSN